MKLAIAALVVVVGFATVAHADPLRTDAIETSMKIAKSTWTPMVTVDVVLTAKNITMFKQSMKVMSCSWPEHLKSSDPDFTWYTPDCKKNALETIELARGESRTWTLKMYATKEAKRGTHKMRLIFTPRGGDPLWTNLVTITVTK